ncbi:hypothetical protein B0H63DRAFT_547212 [Podospora didyma]|uniref:RING-type domain-containing protein n=1 Tax=Podospora didyma TaxID=330526 RepID=A0AAE0NBJ3_9PEZI|nr:hypothetical protein B0H63DRAFT_547212 [Podospora didyma]
MASLRWLELRSGLPGQCAFLLEHRRAYEVFDQPESQPRMVLAVGSKRKRRFLESQLGNAGPGNGGVALRTLSPSTVVVDCEMHDAHVLPRIKPGPLPGGYLKHPLHLATNSRPHQIAHDLYWQVLVPFASAVFLFLEDSGGLDPVVETLATWVRQSILLPIQCPPRILILYQDDAKPVVAQFDARLRARIKAILHHLDPLKIATDSRVDLQHKMAFESVQFSPVSSLSKISAHIKHSFEARVAAGLAFNGEHLKYLFQEAVHEFGQARTVPFDFYRASRLRNPLPKDLTNHVVDFIIASQSSAIDQATLIASALDLDAHPPGMHFFCPDQTFDRFYGTMIFHVGKRVGDASLMTRVRARFAEIALERRHGSSVLSHVRLLHKFRAFWMECYCDTSCLVCLVRSPVKALTCGHQLCNTCIVTCGLSPRSDPWRFRIGRCPLCQEINDNSLSLQPPTAGTRVLKIGGSVRSKAVLMQFLMEFQTLAGLLLCPLRDQFDLVIGSDIGALLHGHSHNQG